MNVFCFRRWSLVILAASVVLVLCSAAGLAQEATGTGVVGPGSDSQGAPESSGEVAPGIPSTEHLTEKLEASYRAYNAILTGYFQRTNDGAQGFEAVRSAVVSLATEGVDRVLSGNSGGQRLLNCLTELSGDGVLAAELAALAQRNGRPAFVQEYLRTWCNVPLGSPYAKGKVAVSGARVGKRTGDIGADKAMVWLAADRGMVGGTNGHPDPGEWVDLKLSIVNRSQKQTYQGATARLAVVGEKDTLCPIWPPLDPEAPVFSPAGCDKALSIGPPSPLADLSPGEHATVGTFGLVLAPGLASGSVSLALVIEAPGAPASMTYFSLPVGKLPLLEIAGLKVDDDAAGQSRGNGNGRIEPGERIELKAQLAAVGTKQFSRVAVSAHQFSGFLDLAPRVLGISTLVEKKPASLGGDFQFEIPTIDAMAAVPAERLDRQFFMDREVNLWVAASGCAGKAEVSKDWASMTPSSYLCPAGAPGYRYVLPVPLSIEFDQVLVINTAPAGARVRVNGVLVGETGRGIPVVFTQISPVRNNILYYQVAAELPGYQTRVVEVPVIYKDRTASNLTGVLNLELDEVRPELPAEPPPAEPPTFWEEAKPRSEPELPPLPEPGGSGGFFLFAGGAFRNLIPEFERKDLLVEKVRSIPVAGFEMGGGYQLGRFFFVSLDSSVLFPAVSPAYAAFNVYLPDGGEGQPVAGKGTMALYEVDSVLAWTLCAQPGFQATLGRVSFLAAAGFQLEGMTADLPDGHTTTEESPVKLSSVGYSARLSAGLNVRIVDGLALYARGLFALPRSGFDWGTTGGIRLNLF